MASNEILALDGSQNSTFQRITRTEKINGAITKQALDVAGPLTDEELRAAPLSVNATPAFFTLSSGMPAVVPVDGTSTLVLASNVDRKFAWVVNNSTETVYLQLGAPAVFGRGQPLRPHGSIYFSGGDLFSGDVYAISSSAILDVDVTEMI